MNALSHECYLSAIKCVLMYSLMSESLHKSPCSLRWEFMSVLIYSSIHIFMYEVKQRAEFSEGIT